MKAFGFFLGLCLYATGAMADMYLVRDIPVDVTDENATIAREKAIMEAQERGFYKLLERLTVPSDMKDLPVLTTDDMLNLVQDYSVADEKTSSVRYIADVSVQFNPRAIQTFFQEYHVPYITSSADKSLIIPLYRADVYDRPVVWDNPWVSVWQNDPQNSDLVPVVVPMGDADDKIVVSDDTVADEMHLDMAPLYKKYQALSALVIEAVVYKDMHQVYVTVRPFQNERSYMGVIRFYEPIDAPIETVLVRAKNRIFPLLEQKWREQNAVRFDNPSSLVTIVPIQNLGEWIAIRGRLDKIKLIKQYVVKAVRKDQAQIEIFFAGELTPFLKTVQREGLFLSPASDDLWSLRDLNDVPSQEINAMQLKNTPQTQEDAQRAVVNEPPIAQIVQPETSGIPVMRMDEYQVIESVTQPESAELLKQPYFVEQEMSYE